MKKETPTQIFSCEYCKIFKNSSFYRKPPVAGSVRDFFIKAFVEFKKIFCTKVTTNSLHVQSQCNKIGVVLVYFLLILN